MGLRKMKDALKKALADSPGDKRLHRKLKGTIRAKRAERKLKASFPGAHRGY